MKTTSLLILAVLVVSCSEDVNPSLFDSNASIGETPVISSVDFEGKGLAGVTVYTITGQNFLSQAELNHVYFGSKQGKVLEASSTKLVVIAPDNVGDSLDLKVDVQGAQLFSNAIKVDLHSAIFEVFPFNADLEKPFAFTLDDENNLYFSYTLTGAGQGISKLSADSGLISNIGPKKGETFYNGLKYNASNTTIYGVWNGRAVFSSTIGNGTTDVFAAISGNQFLFDLDFDQELNIWTGGDGKKISSITPDKVISGFDFEPVLSSLRVYNDYLYVSGAMDDSIQAVWRFELFSADSLGQSEIYFDFSNHYSSNITAITFSNEGELFVGTDGDEVIIIVSPDGMHEEFYPGVLAGPVLYFAWDTGDFLYYTREASSENNQTILKIDMERLGAPHYGRD